MPRKSTAYRTRIANPTHNKAGRGIQSKPSRLPGTPAAAADAGISIPRQYIPCDSETRQRLENYRVNSRIGENLKDIVGEAINAYLDANGG